MSARSSLSPEQEARLQAALSTATGQTQLSGSGAGQAGMGTPLSAGSSGQQGGGATGQPDDLAARQGGMAGLP